MGISIPGTRAAYAELNFTWMTGESFNIFDAIKDGSIYSMEFFQNISKLSGKSPQELVKYMVNYIEENKSSNEDENESSTTSSGKWEPFKKWFEESAFD